MKKLYALAIAVIAATSLNAQSICDPGGNVVIYSNYDGGPLTINVDQNIPNLKIGVLSYEFCRITVTGTYAGNVTQLWYIGYDGNNDNCSLGSPLNTTISGVPNPVDSIILYPAATYTNPNGSSAMICNYTCNTTTNQGGCNTADQTAHYFLTQFGGSLLFHQTQYGCWSGTLNISAGGNCCSNPMTGIDNLSEPLFQLSPNPACGYVTVNMPTTSEVRTAEIVNVLGEVVCAISISPGTSSQQVSLVGFARGTYFFRMQSGESITTEKLIITE